MNISPISEPSLSSRAMLCSLSIRMWSARKHDAEASEEIATRHGAQADAGRYHKILISSASAPTSSACRSSSRCCACATFRCARRRCGIRRHTRVGP